MKSDRSHWADRTEYSRSCEKHLDKTALSRRSKSVLTYLTPLVHSPRQVPTRCRRRWRCRRVVAPRWAQMRPSDAQECSPSQPPPSRLSSPACLTTIVDIRLRPGQVLPPPSESFYTRATAEPSRGYWHGIDKCNFWDKRARASVISNLTTTSNFRHLTSPSRWCPLANQVFCFEICEQTDK